jgi:hypothetical protein
VLAPHPHPHPTPHPHPHPTQHLHLHPNRTLNRTLALNQTLTLVLDPHPDPNPHLPPAGVNDAIVFMSHMKAASDAYYLKHPEIPAGERAIFEEVADNIC